MEPKILFLDFDGPLFSTRMIDYHPENHINHSRTAALLAHAEKVGDTFAAKTLSYSKMEEGSVALLNKLMADFDFKTVISSSWRNICGKELVEHLFEINGLSLVLHEDWATPRKMSSERIHEITWWLDKHPACSYAIVDDVESGYSLGELVAGNFEWPLNKDAIVLVDLANGFSIADYYKVRKMFE